MLVLGLDQDQVVSLESVHRCACQCNRQEVILPGSGHDIMLDTGWDDAARTMLGWLDECGL